MPVKLLVRRKQSTDASEQDSFIYEDDRITIGRDPSNSLVLADEKKIVGRKHAEIHRSGGVYHVVDLESKNFTYLRGERLEASRPYPLREGDVFKIGDFEIEFALTAPARPDRDRTVFVANPFLELADELADMLRRMDGTFEQTPGQREAALDEALRRAFAGEAASDEIASRVASALGGTQSVSLPQQSTPIPRDKIVETLLRFASALAGIPSRFRHEFIGETIARSTDTSFLYDGDPESLREHLLDPTVSDEELDRRLAVVDKAAETLAHHQVALLEGYKASILTGVHRFLDLVDPDTIEKQLAQEQPLFRVLPILGKLRVLRRLAQACRELRSEDWAAAERRVFRPAFVRAYLAGMTSLAKNDPEVEAM
jgi:predicted component of type VI protein secretion system